MKSFWKFCFLEKHSGNYLYHILYFILYLQQHNEKDENSYFSKWKDTDVLEMKKFFGLVTLMGVIHKMNLHM